MSEPALALVQSSNTLLDYGLTTSPAPLQISASATAPSHGTITIVVSNSSPNDVQLSSIEIDLVVGDPSSPEGDDLTEVGAGIAISVSDPAWQGSYPGTTDGRLLVTPAKGVPVTIGDQGLAITITNIQVSTQPGTTKVTIAEKAAVGGNPPSLTTAVLAVAKFPVGFSAGGFSITKPVVPNGTGATLTWYGTQGTGIAYQILWTGAPADVSTVQTWTSPPLTDTTTFILQVTASTPNGPVQLMFPVTQIVSDPDLVAQSIHVLGPSALDGPVTTSGLTASGTATAATLAATSAVTAPSATLTSVQAGTLNVATTAAFAAGSTLTGSINATAAALAALGTAVTIDPGTYSANTDGFIVGQVGAPDQSQRDVPCLGTLVVTANDVTAMAMGGNVCTCLQPNGGFWMAPNVGALVLPLSKGTQASIAFNQDGNNQTPAPGSIVFVPLGSSQGQTLIERISDEQPAPPEAFTVAGELDDARRPEQRRRQGPM